MGLGAAIGALVAERAWEFPAAGGAVRGQPSRLGRESRRRTVRAGHPHSVPAPLLRCLPHPARPRPAADYGQDPHACRPEARPSSAVVGTVSALGSTYSRLPGGHRECGWGRGVIRRPYGSSVTVVLGGAALLASAEVLADGDLDAADEGYVKGQIEVADSVSDSS